MRAALINGEKTEVPNWFVFTVLYLVYLYTLICNSGATTEDMLSRRRENDMVYELYRSKAKEQRSAPILARAAARH